MTIEDYATAKGITRQYVYRLIRAERLASVRVEGQMMIDSETTYKPLERVFGEDGDTGTYITKKLPYGSPNAFVGAYWNGPEGLVRLSKIARASRACGSCGKTIDTGSRYLCFPETKGRDRNYCWPCATLLVDGKVRWPCRELDRAMSSR